MKVIHSWLKELVGGELPDVQKTEELLTFHAFEVDGIEAIEDEAVLDVKILPDRSSDCLSVRGIAKDLSAILGVKLANDPLRDQINLVSTETVSIAIENNNLCERFTISVINGVDVKESPAWLQKRLRVLGLRPINNIVDATNYVMLLLGQPMHAYDAKAFPIIAGKKQIGVRSARVDEQISLLAEGGKNEDRLITLTGNELVITEATTDTPIGLAGIKGGRFAELNENTKDIIIEAAHFDATIIRQTARRFNILTDAAKRFENNPATQLPVYAQQQIINLILEIAGGEYVGTVDLNNTEINSIPVTVTTEKVNDLLGLSLSLDTIKDILERIGAEIVEQNDEIIKVLPPWERTDLVSEVNFIDEIGRIYGLTKINSIFPTPLPIHEINSPHFYSEKIRKILIEEGFSEVITSSFQKQGKIQLQNALASDKSYMRECLQKNIQVVLDANFVHVDLLGLVDVRVFEIGTVFTKTETKIDEYVSLAMGVRTKGNGYNQKDDVILNQACQKLAEALNVKIDWKMEKGVAECNLTELIVKLPVPTAYQEIEKTLDVTYKSVSPYPAIARDIALWVTGSVEATVVKASLEDAAGPLLVRNTLFDTFTKDNRTSYAFRLVFQATDRTLTDDEIVPIMDNVYQIVRDQGWEVR